ncbi:MAG: hypothetical protein PVI06_21315 [Desulfobacterales bacterium]|jgi:hypothetical protein
MTKAKKNLQLIPSATSESLQKEDRNSRAPHDTVEVSVQEKNDLYQPHKGDELQKRANVLTKVYLVNKLNYTNFQNGTVLVNLKHTKYNRTLILHAIPQPCEGDQLDCHWVQTEGIQQKLKLYHFTSFYLTDGNKLIMVEPQLLDINHKGISFILPDACYEVGSRSMTRHVCQGISVQFIQNSSLFHGTLLDFNAVSFRIELKATASQTFQWINPESIVSIILSDGPEMLYSGECRIIRQTWGQRTRKYVVEPLKQEIQRYRHKEYRCDRQEIKPSPDMVFKHPFTKKTVSLKVIDLSGFGFSVEEDENNAMLIPGMNIPEVRLRFGDDTPVKCKAQVVYRKMCDGGNKGLWVKCGLTILDMALEANVKLLSLLQLADHRYSYICNDVDLDELWDFFFETGFIYPEKYAYIEANKAHIKETYKKLYTQNLNIARHFIFQEKGQIMGHMAMVRFFENAWLIHHHAARKFALNKAGLIVLKQIGRFINDSYRLRQLHMDYVFSYYRSENKFPSRVFGGATQNISDPKGCSVDIFAYFHFPANPRQPVSMPNSWRLTKACSEDLLDLESYYECESGGLMLNAFGLTPEMFGQNELIEEYQRLGFNRGKYLFSLKNGDILKAVILVNISDIGLNLSNLTNSVHIIVLDSDDLTRDIFFQTLTLTAEKLNLDELTILIYPVSLANNLFIPYEKIYNLWIMSTHYSDPYFRYLERLLKFI